MFVTLDEMKNYLRVDDADDDALLEAMIRFGTQLCMDVARMNNLSTFEAMPDARVAVMYAVAYLYEHREEADHKALTLNLRALLQGCREEGF